MVVCEWTTQQNFGQRLRYCSLNAHLISVPARYRLELEIPRNPTVVLFLKIPRVLCSHPLTGGPGIFFPNEQRCAPRVELQIHEKRRFFLKCLGAINHEQAERFRHQSAADVSSAELFPVPSAGKMPVAWRLDILPG